MYRRRRLSRDPLAFGFDSFLDVVANVIGIVVRLILVAWVGARAYQAGMDWRDAEPIVASLPAPKLEDHPLHPEIERLQSDLEKTFQRLAQLLEAQERRRAEIDVAATPNKLLTERRQALEQEIEAIEATRSRLGTSLVSAGVSVAELRERQKKLDAELAQLEAMPSLKKRLTYYSPVSQDVQGDEIFFEIRDGRVAFIDLPTFLTEAKQVMQDAGERLRDQWSFEQVTTQAGAFRLRFTIERERDLFDVPGKTRPRDRDFSFGITRWEIEPIAKTRGETATQALAAGSEFRQLVDRLDPKFATITLWVYPDSFETFRALRAYLYERNLEVASRPLPIFAPIAASRHGTASRAQ